MEKFNIFSWFQLIRLICLILSFFFWLSRVVQMFAILTTILRLFLIFFFTLSSVFRISNSTVFIILSILFHLSILPHSSSSADSSISSDSSKLSDSLHILRLSKLRIFQIYVSSVYSINFRNWVYPDGGRTSLLHFACFKVYHNVLYEFF